MALLLNGRRPPAALGVRARVGRRHRLGARELAVAHRRPAASARQLNSEHPPAELLRSARPLASPPDRLFARRALDTRTSIRRAQRTAEQSAKRSLADLNTRVHRSRVHDSHQIYLLYRTLLTSLFSLHFLLFFCSDSARTYFHLHNRKNCVHN